MSDPMLHPSRSVFVAPQDDLRRAVNGIVDALIDVSAYDEETDEHKVHSLAEEWPEMWAAIVALLEARPLEDCRVKGIDGMVRGRG